MKKSYYFLAGMALLGLMTGCSNELDEPGANPNGDAVRIMFEAPEALQVTRAVTGTNSAQGGVTNVDWSSTIFVIRWLFIPKMVRHCSLHPRLR